MRIKVTMQLSYDDEESENETEATEEAWISGHNFAEKRLGYGERWEVLKVEVNDL